MNPSDPLVLRSSCLTCPWTNKNLTFKWKLYLISNDSAPDADPECVYPVTETDKNQNEKMSANTKRRTTRAPTWGRYLSANPTPYSTRKRPAGNIHITSKPSEELDNNIGSIVEKGNICYSPITVPTVTPTTRCKWVPRKPSYGFGFRSGTTASSGVWSCSTAAVPSGKHHFRATGHIRGIDDKENIA